MIVAARSFSSSSRYSSCECVCRFANDADCPVTPLSELDTIEKLERKLESARDDLITVRSLFTEHVRSDFLHRFVLGELQNLALNPDHVVRKNAGQVSFTLINNTGFDYTIRLAAPFSGHPHTVKWLGEQQIMSVKGAGCASIRILTVPCDINRFRAGVQIANVEMVNLEQGSFLESASSNCILDVYEVKEPVIFEVLTIHDERIELHWTFDEHLRSMFAESSRMICSRLQNVLELARKMGKPVPDAFYDVMLTQGNAQTKLLAIRTLLATDSAAGFRELQQAIDSKDDTLSTGAQLIFDALMTRA